MAPPLEALRVDEVPQPDCPLKQIMQYDCKIRGDQIVCEEVKRLFKVCAQRMYEVPSDMGTFWATSANQ